MIKCLKIISYLTFFTVFCSLTHAAEVRYSRSGDLPYIVVNASQLQSFVEELYNIVKEKCNDSFTDYSELEFSSECGGATVSSDSIKNIFSHLDCVDPLTNVWLRASGCRPGSFSFDINLNKYSNTYSVRGYDRIAVDATESSIIRFAAEHKAWPSKAFENFLRWLFWAVGTIFIFLLISRLGRKSSTARFLTYSILGFVFMGISFLISGYDLFPAALVWNVKQASILERSQPLIGLLALIVNIIGIGLIIYFELKKTPSRR